MIDLKKTLNLPSTKFPMKANLPVKELEIQKEWKETDIYNEMQTYRKDSPLFILHDGPPYANGNIHIGHAVNKILKDINLFDEYKDKKIGKGKKSFAISFTFNDSKKTLTDQVIDKIMIRLSEKITSDFGATIRDK